MQNTDLTAREKSGAKLTFLSPELQAGISNKEMLGAEQGELCGDKKASLCFPRFQWNNSGENSPSINTNIPWEHPQCSQQGTGAAAVQGRPHCLSSPHLPGPGPPSPHLPGPGPPSPAGLTAGLGCPRPWQPAAPAGTG